MTQVYKVKRPSGSRTHTDLIGQPKNPCRASHRIPIDSTESPSMLRRQANATLTAMPVASRISISFKTVPTWANMGELENPTESVKESIRESRESPKASGKESGKTAAGAFFLVFSNRQRCSSIAAQFRFHKIIEKIRTHHKFEKMNFVEKMTGYILVVIQVGWRRNFELIRVVKVN